MNHNYIMKNFYIQNIIPSRNSSYPTLRFKGLETLWVKQLVDQLVHFNNGISGDVKLNGGRYKLTRIETISKEFVDITKLGFTNSKPSAEKILKKGDILFSNINSIEHIGKMAVFNLEIPIYHGINLLRMSPINNVNPYFIFYTLSKQEYKNWIISRSNKAVSQASINKSTLGNLDLLVPGYDEQNKIANFLTKIDKLIYFRKQKIEHLKQLKKKAICKSYSVRSSLAKKSLSWNNNSKDIEGYSMTKNRWILGICTLIGLIIGIILMNQHKSAVLVFTLMGMAVGYVIVFWIPQLKRHFQNKR